MGSSDQKLKKEMAKKLEDAMAYHEELKVKREQSLWKNAGAPCLLHEALSRLTKTEMDEIRKTHRFSKMSALKKADLSKELSMLIPIILESLLYTWDEERYEVIQKIISQNGIVSNDSVSSTDRERLRSYGFLFNGIYQNEKVLFIPEDLMNQLRKLDYKEFKAILKRNNDWIRMTPGLLYYVGVSDYWNVIKKISSLTKKKIDSLEYLGVIHSAIRYYDEINMFGATIFHNDVPDIHKVIREQRTRAKAPDYPFTKEQLLLAGSPGHIEKTPEMRKLLQFIQNLYSIPDEEVDDIAIEIIQLINETGDPIEVLKYLEDILEFPGPDFVKPIADLVMNLYNNSRQWDLLGYTPLEFSKSMKVPVDSVLSPLVKMNTALSRPTEKSASVKTGRNDLCPCGSGKKYKKCCGRP